jgi:peptidoglycan DL-endopeptidase RipB
MRHEYPLFVKWAWLLGVLPILVALAAPAAAEPGDGQWDPTLPKIISSSAPGDPVAIANASLQASQLATQTTMDLGRKFLSSLGFGGAPTGVAPGRVRGSQAIEYVIRRGASQMGVPYSWGGGGPKGPSLGVDSGANTVGYDCSGFTQFAFAGVGVLIPNHVAPNAHTAQPRLTPTARSEADLRRRTHTCVIDLSCDRTPGFSCGPYNGRGLGHITVAGLFHRLAEALRSASQLSYTHRR